MRSEEKVEEIDILSIPTKCQNHKFCILNELFKLEQNNYIRLYAGTYSFGSALEKLDTDQASFYFYKIKSREGFLFHIHSMFTGIQKDDNIFKFSHKYLYNKNHLSNFIFDERDQRSGEFFSKKHPI